MFLFLFFPLPFTDYDPKVVEQKEQAQPACLPLSYVLRFISEDARKESPFLSANAAGAELKRKLAIKHHSYSMSSSNRSNTPTGEQIVRIFCLAIRRNILLYTPQNSLIWLRTLVIDKWFLFTVVGVCVLLQVAKWMKMKWLFPSQRIAMIPGQPKNLVPNS